MVAAPALPVRAPLRFRARSIPGQIALDATPMVFTQPVMAITPANLTFDDTLAPPLQVTQPAPSPDRWSASAWLVARDGSGTGAAPRGQLGGSQAGARVAYLLAPRQRISAFGRVTAPLAGKGSEAAIGIEWQPWKAPIRLALEHRIGVDGAPNGTGAGVTGGLYREAKAFRIEGYGQAGAIARNRIEPYADAAIRVTRLVSPRLSLGAGAWGGAQRDAQRLDIGPSGTLALGKIRVSLDWRQRIAGSASPGSGLALTLGGDF